MLRMHATFTHARARSKCDLYPSSHASTLRLFRARTHPKEVCAFAIQICPVVNNEKRARDEIWDDAGRNGKSFFMRIKGALCWGESFGCDINAIKLATKELQVVT